MFQVDGFILTRVHVRGRPCGHRWEQRDSEDGLTISTVAGSIAALVADEPGSAVGIVVGGLAVILGALSALSGQEGRSRLAT